MQQLSELSHIGLVYPGVEHLGASSRTDYRTGGQANHEIDHFLWSDRFADDPTDTTAAFWLAASHLSVGRLDHADDILRQALRLTPAARELRHLMAIVAYRRNDLVLASRELDLLLGTHPDDALATLNRAVLEVEAGRGLAVCSVLERIARSAENAAIRHRAAQLIRDAGCR